jgi:hypothetical protein
MAARPSNAVHPIGCPCRACAPVAHRHRAGFTIRSASRALVLLATLIAIPFLVAQALAGLKGGRG